MGSQIEQTAAGIQQIASDTNQTQSSVGEMAAAADYDRQLERWRSERLTGAQMREIARLQGIAGGLRLELTRIVGSS